MRIFIAGGAGFVGSSVALKLRNNYPNYEISVFDNLKRRGSELNIPALVEAGIKFYHGDIRCKEDLDSVEPFDVLIEASAEPSVMAGIGSNPFYVINNNLVGSVNCFNLCLKYQARVVFLSTSRVYPIRPIENANYEEMDTRFVFANSQNEPGISRDGIDETLSLIGARSFYGTTKLSSELFLEEYGSFYGLQSAITRFGVIAGPRQMGKTDQGIATLWMAKHFWKQSLKYIGYGGLGKQVRDILHIDDLIELIDMQIHQPEKFAGKIYNAGGGLQNGWSLAEMTAICEQITGNKIQIGSDLETRPADLKCYISNNAKIEREIGWAPSRSVERVFEDIFEWIKANEAELKPILG